MSDHQIIDEMAQAIRTVTYCGDPQDWEACPECVREMYREYATAAFLIAAEKSASIASRSIFGKTAATEIRRLMDEVRP